MSCVSITWDVDGDPQAARTNSQDLTRLAYTN